MSNFGPMNVPATPGLPTLPQGDQIGRYASYLQAQRAVDFLSDNHFPVQFVTIVGTGLQMVERVTGRLTYAKVALSGVLSGAYFGGFVGIAMYLFSSVAMENVFILMGMGAGFGLLFGVIAYARSGGRRDFTSTSQIVATEYLVLCLSEKSGEARTMLRRLPGGAGSEAEGLFVAPQAQPWAPVVTSPYGPPPVAGEPRHDGPAPETAEPGAAGSGVGGAAAATGTSEAGSQDAAPVAPTGPTYGEMMEKRRREEKAKAAQADRE